MKKVRLFFSVRRVLIVLAGVSILGLGALLAVGALAQDRDRDQDPGRTVASNEEGATEGPHAQGATEEPAQVEGLDKDEDGDREKSESSDRKGWFGLGRWFNGAGLDDVDRWFNLDDVGRWFNWGGGRLFGDGEGDDGLWWEARWQGIGVNLAELLGIEAMELWERLVDGESVADVATAQGVDVQVVIDAYVDVARERLAEAVTEDKISQEQADERLAAVEQMITDLVNGVYDPDEYDWDVYWEDFDGDRFRDWGDFDGEWREKWNEYWDEFEWDESDWEKEWEQFYEWCAQYELQCDDSQDSDTESEETSLEI